MSELRIETWSMPAANLGLDNPLPPLTLHKSSTQFIYPPDVPDKMRENLEYGHVSSILPYTIQDLYDRKTELTDFRTAVLENDILRATFLLEFGGRLWSLVHKPSGREMLEVNPVFQLANLAFREAWFSGGVEWNIGTIGHSPLTCSPLFASRLDRSDGTPILRLSEWERIRQVSFQIDAYLPDGSPLLFLRIRIRNPNKHEVPMYWWSNIAIPESPDTRVIVPANTAYCLGDKPGQLTRIPIPNHDGIDISYSTNASHAADYFFEIPDGQRPWITALDDEGRGLVHVSTDRMRGRKLWVWGGSPGGRNWQIFLSPPGDGYIEIQAGLTRTQLEYQRMPAGADWSWLEAYGLLQADPQIVHGTDWELVRQHINEELDRLCPQTILHDEYELGAKFSDSAPTQLIQRGSGWGALENRRREIFNEPLINAPGLSFDVDSLSDEQLPWIVLLEKGSFPIGDPKKALRGYVVGQKWLGLLEDTVDNGADKNWMAHYHLGVIKHHTGDLAGARQAWMRSLDLEWTPWAVRNLAVLAEQDGKIDEAADMLLEAFNAVPNSLSLLIECGRILIGAGRLNEWMQLIEGLSQEMRSNGRIRLLEAQAALAAGKLKIVEQFFEDQVIVADLREGETSLTDLWFKYQEQQLRHIGDFPADQFIRERVETKFPLPEFYDFRMETGGDEEKDY